MQIESVPIESLIPYARNARTHSEEQVAQIAGSIREFGFTNPVLIDGEGGIIAGHGRVMAARKLGLADVPCIRLSHLTEAQRRAYIIADNKLALNAGWDNQMLALEFQDLQGMGFDIELTGFALGDINELLAELDATPEGSTDSDEVPQVQADAISKLGDVWLLGKHRIMCGDSTDAGSVALLMNGRKAALMQTDPPYGIAYVANAQSKGQSVAHADIENDDLDGEKLQAFLEAQIRAALPSLNKNCAFYLWHPMLTQGTFFAAAAAADILIHRQIIWQKPSLVFGRGDYHWQHELCFYGWVRGNRPPFYGPRNQTTLWTVGRETSKDHPTAKPVDLWKPPIENHTKPGEVMFEPFSGSGSQIISAEQTGRICCAMELSPNYVDVAVRRWQQFTGKRAVHAATGKSFDDIAAANAQK
jgi:DNA modification methylase